MELLYLLLVVGFSVINLGRCQETLRELLQKESRFLAAYTPSNVWRLVSNIRPNTDAFTERLRKEDINKLQGKIDNDSLQKFKGIIFSNSMALKSFSFASSPRGFTLEQRLLTTKILIFLRLLSLKLMFKLIQDKCLNISQ